jgi:putative transposase
MKESSKGERDADATLERKSIRVRLEPNPGQREKLAQAAGSRRFIYNWALNRWQEHYAEHKNTISLKDLSRDLTELKYLEETVWLQDVDSQLQQQALADVRSSFQNFFAKRARYPRFRCKGRVKESFRIPQRVTVKGRRLYVPKVGHVRTSELIDLAGLTHKSTTFSLDSDGHWYASLMVQFELTNLPLPKLRDDEKTIGIDLGLKDLMVLSDGTVHENPRWYRKHELKLAKAQRELSRKKKVSKNREKAKRKVARAHAKVRQTRADHIHKLTTDLVQKHDTIVIEDLCVKGMAKTKLSKSIYDAALGEIRRQLEYKARWNHKRLIVIDRWFPSSKTCSGCGFINQELELKDRSWTCEGCQVEHDRDWNASINIRTEGLRQAGLVAVGNTETLNACGEPVRRQAASAAGATLVETRTPRIYPWEFQNN